MELILCIYVKRIYVFYSHLSLFEYQSLPIWLKVRAVISFYAISKIELKQINSLYQLVWPFILCLVYLHALVGTQYVKKQYDLLLSAHSTISICSSTSFAERLVAFACIEGIFFSGR